MIALQEHFKGKVNAPTMAASTAASCLVVYAITFTAGAHIHWHAPPRVKAPT